MDLNKITAKNYKQLSKKCLQDLAIGGYYQELTISGTMYVLIELGGDRKLALLFSPNSVGNWRLVAKQPNLNKEKFNEWVNKNEC